MFLDTYENEIINLKTEKESKFKMPNIQKNVAAGEKKKRSGFTSEDVSFLFQLWKHFDPNKM